MFVAVNMRVEETLDIFRFLVEIRALNAIVVGKFDEKFHVLSYNPYLAINEQVYWLNVSHPFPETAFPDKLLDLNGYVYRVMFYEYKPRLTVIDGEVHGPEVEFMKVVAEKQNARLNFTHVASLDRFERRKQFAEALQSFTIDVFLNTDIVSSSNRNRLTKVVNTFETDGWCIILPHPDLITTFDFMFKPFDLPTWILIFVSMFICAIAWKLSNKCCNGKTSSSLYFIFAFISSFLKQLIPIQENRKAHKMIVLAMILLTCTLSCFYESFITALIANIQHRVRIKNIDEVITRNISLYAPSNFENHLSDSEHVIKLKLQIIGDFVDSNKRSLKEFTKESIGIIISCATYGSEGESKELLSDFFYKVDQEFNTHYLEFLMSFTSLHRRIAEFSLKVFESGLRIAWNNKLGLHPSHVNRASVGNDDEAVSSLEDLAPAFFLLLLGLLISFITFLIELTHNDLIQLIIYIKNYMFRLKVKKRKRVRTGIRIRSQKRCPPLQCEDQE